MKKILMFMFFIFIVLFITGCGNEKDEEIFLPSEIVKIDIDYEKEMYYSETKNITITSSMENDDIYIRNLTKDIIKLDLTNPNNIKVSGISEGIGKIFIANSTGIEKTIEIKVLVKPGFAPDITNLDLIIEYKDIYYVNKEYKIDVVTIPTVYKDSYRFIKSDKYEINETNNTIKFLKPGKVIVSVFADNNSVRCNLKLNVEIDKNDDSYMNILYVGNSLTYVFDIPSLVESMLKKDGKTVSITRILKGGATLSDSFNEYEETLNKSTFTHIIVQEQSFRPVRDMSSFIFDVERMYKLASMQDAKFLLYQTWAYNIEPGKTYKSYTKDSMQEKLVNSYNEASNVAGNSKVIRSGEAFNLFEKTYGLTPSLYKDFNHQSYEGALLSSACHYIALTNNTNINNEYFPNEVSIDTIEKIINIAKKLNFN